MCNNKDAERLVKEAKQLEKSDPFKAREHYLEAAEIMLYLSTQDKTEEGKYVEFAHKLYEKAKQLDPTATLSAHGHHSASGHHPTTDHAHPHHHGHESHEHPQSNTITPSAQIIDPEGFIKKSDILFKDIGGLEELKEEIRFKIIEPLQHPGLFAYYGKKMGGGILMYGPPGCGKTLIAQATANEAHATFFHVKSSDLKSKYVGETEKNIAELFEKARKHQPSIIFFDEFEALGADRTAAQHAHEISSVAQLLTEMDGMGTKDQKILLLAATNEPWAIDPALRREGRFGETLFIPPPDVIAREQVLRVHMKGRPLSKDVEFKALAQQTEHWSGADLMGLCEMATDIPLKEYFTTRKQRPVGMKDFLQAMKRMNSVTIPWLRKAQRVVKERKLEESFAHLLRFVDEKVKAVS